MPQSRSKPALDMDELAPDRFLVHNPRIFALLKGEGQADGRLFELTTWRRDGLLARLRERSFAVRTIAERIAALPAPPPAPPIGAEGWRPLATPQERFGYLDPAGVRWRLLEPGLRDGAAGVSIAEGWVVRRRKGRGPWSHFLAFRERGGIGLRPLDETAALLAGYAQAAAIDPQPWPAERRPEGVRLPEAELPPAYREVLGLLTRSGADGPIVGTERGWLLAQELFGRLGVRLVLEGEPR